MTDTKSKHESTRREVWINTAVAVAGAWNCEDKDAPAMWADAVLADFDKRFPKPIEERRRGQRYKK